MFFIGDGSLPRLKGLTVDGMSLGDRNYAQSRTSVCWGAFDTGENFQILGIGWVTWVLAAWLAQVIAEDTNEAFDESSGADDDVGQRFSKGYGKGLRHTRFCEDGEEKVGEKE